MAVVLLITEDALKDATIIRENVDMKICMPVIVKCQDIQIQTCLGSSLYQDILAKVTTGLAPNDPNGYYTLLTNYIQPALKAWIVAELPMHLSYQYTNKGIMQKSSDNSVAPDIYAILKMCDRWKNDAEFYTERLSKHLYANPDIYPLFLQFTGNSIERIPPAGTSYNTGMFLGMTYKDDARIPFSEIYQGQNGMTPDQLADADNETF